MDSEAFVINWLAFTLAALLGLVFLFLLMIKRRIMPHIQFSHTKPLSSHKKSFKEKAVNLPRRLQTFAMLFFIFAFIDPHWVTTPEALKEEKDTLAEEEKKTEQLKIPTEGIALYLVLDQSSSMSENVKLVTKKGKAVKVPRIELLKSVTQKFIEGDPALNLPGLSSDLVGLISFARVPHVLSPLTLDHDSVIEKLNNLQTVKTEAQDGTAMGYAILKTASLIVATKHYSQELVSEGQPSYDIKSTVMVLVTDGLHNPHPLDLSHEQRSISMEKAAAFAKEHGIHLYIINVEPAILLPNYDSDRELLDQVAKTTGGRFFVADSLSKLGEVFKEIETLEKFILPQEKIVQAEVTEQKERKDQEVSIRKRSYFPFFISLGAFLLASSFILHTTWLRRIP